MFGTPLPESSFISLSDAMNRALNSRGRRALLDGDFNEPIGNSGFRLVLDVFAHLARIDPYSLQERAAATNSDPARQTPEMLPILDVFC